MSNSKDTKIKTSFGTFSEKEIADAEVYMRNFMNEMNRGIFNRCVNGECIKCGECCSNFLPMNQKEVRRIRRIVRDRKLKPINHLPVLLARPGIDLVCPFYDPKRADKACVIYDDRPLICRDFQCNKYGSNFELNREFLKDDFELIDVRKEFWK